jgi:hypothetical protein
MKNKILERMMLLTNYDSSKTLNENKEVIFEQSTVSVDELVKKFHNASLGVWNATRGFKDVFNLIKDSKQFVEFFNAYKSKYDKTISQVINTKYGSGNHRDVYELSKLLKDRFNYTPNPGIKYFNKTTGRWEKLTNIDDYDKIIDMNPQFEKLFQVFPGNVVPQQQQQQQQQPDPNKKDGYDAYMATVGTNPAAPATPPAPAAAPQTFDDVLSGRGVLKLGSKSPAVGELQQKLIKLGYTTIVKPTNYYGDLTKNAVLDFQTKQKLAKFDGIVGRETSNRINQILNQPAAAPTTTTPNDRGLRTAVQSYTPKGIS